MLAFVLLLCFVCFGVIVSDKGRIYNGYLVPDGTYPFMAAMIRPSGNFFCTATILNEDTILTAAHCVKKEFDVYATKYSVYVGHHDITKERRDKNYLYPVARFIPHEEYGPKKMSTGFDVGVVKLARKIKFGPRVQKVRLPELGIFGISADLENCMAIGWGKTNTDMPQHIKLSHVKVPIHPGDKCNARNDVRYVICSHEKTAGRGVCQGDSGGPLICPLNSSTWLQFGINSFNIHGCGKDSNFVRVTAYVDWIKNKAGPDIQVERVVKHVKHDELKLELMEKDKTDLSEILIAICAVAGVLLVLLVGVVIFKVTKKAKDKHNLEAAKQKNKAHGHAKRPPKTTGTETKTPSVTTSTSMETNSLNSRSKSSTKTRQGRSASNRTEAKGSVKSTATQTSRKAKSLVGKTASKH